MWVFTDRGFYSVVEAPGREGTFVVRARAKADLLALAELLPGMKIVKLKNRDYQFRTFVKRADWERAIVLLTRDIDYSNFKNAVYARQGMKREAIYHRIWAVALSIAPRRRGDYPSFLSD